MKGGCEQSVDLIPDNGCSKKMKQKVLADKRFICAWLFTVLSIGAIFVFVVSSMMGRTLMNCNQGFGLHSEKAPSSVNALGLL